MLHGRTLKWSAWLGWQIESNWTTPWLFAAYVLLKPVAGAPWMAAEGYRL